MPQMKMKPSRPVLLLLYGTLAFATGLGISEATISSEVLGPRSDIERTLLEQRIASDREIRGSLRTPLPAVAPLPPITAKLSKPDAVKVAARQPNRRNPWLATNSLPPEALDAMAKSLTQPEPSPAAYSTRYDRAASVF
jgi:hypothetical protein